MSRSNLSLKESIGRVEKLPNIKYSQVPTTKELHLFDFNKSKKSLQYQKSKIIVDKNTTQFDYGLMKKEDLVQEDNIGRYKKSSMGSNSKLRYIDSTEKLFPQLS